MTRSDVGRPSDNDLSFVQLTQFTAGGKLEAWYPMIQCLMELGRMCGYMCAEFIGLVLSGEGERRDLTDIVIRCAHSAATNVRQQRQLH